MLLDKKTSNDDDETNELALLVEKRQRVDPRDLCMMYQFCQALKLGILRMRATGTGAIDRQKNR